MGDASASNELRAKADDLWAEAMAEAYGPEEPLDWSEWPACIVRGVRYE